MSKADISKVLKELSSIKAQIQPKRKTKTKRVTVNQTSALSEAIKSVVTNSTKYKLIEWIRNNYTDRNATDAAKQIGLGESTTLTRREIRAQKL